MSRLRATAGLAAANLTGSLIGMAANFYVLAQTGPQILAQVGLATAGCGIALNLLDVRLADACSRRLVAAGDDRAERADIIRIAVRGGLLGGGLGLLLSLTAAAAAVQFLDQPPAWWAVAAVCLAESLRFAVAPGVQLQRYSKRPFALMAAGQLAGQLVGGLTLVAAITVSPNAGGWALGLLAAACASSAIDWAMCRRLWLRHDRLDLDRPAPALLPALHRDARFLAAGGLMGFGKLLHRGGDLLLVGWWCDDRTTGLYRFARSLTDAGYILFDALNKALQADLQRLVQEGRRAAFLRWARRLAIAGWGGAAVAAVAAWLGAGPLIDLVFAGRYAGSETAIALLLLAYGGVFGCALWTWPALVASGAIAGFGVAYMVATLALQYAAPSLWLWLVGGAPLTPLAAGHAAVFLASYLIAARLALRSLPAEAK